QRQGLLRLGGGAFTAKLLQTQGRDALRMMEVGNANRFPATLHEGLHGKGFRLDRVELEQNPRVVVTLHLSPRLSSRSASEERPTHSSPQTARARPAKSGNSISTGAAG